MFQRVITAIVALAIFLPLLFIGGLPFELLVMVMGIITLLELLRVVGQPLWRFETLVTVIIMVLVILPSRVLTLFPNEINQMILFYAGAMILLFISVFVPDRVKFEQAGTLSLAALYVGRGYHFLIETRNYGLLPLLFVLVIIWGNDSFAYIVGRLIGENKLAPEISPNKTIEGSIGGIVGAFILSSIILYFDNFFGISLLQNIILVTLIGIIGQLGDLVESGIKRAYGVKDSGTILPGHGGLLDRFDNMLIALPMFYFIISFF